MSDHYQLDRADHGDGASTVLVDGAEAADHRGEFRTRGDGLVGGPAQWGGGEPSVSLATPDERGRGDGGGIGRGGRRQFGSCSRRPRGRSPPVVNRERATQGMPPANRKRVHRIMERNAMLLQRHTGRREGRLHNGKVMVMCSNLRWCSDGLEFTCWNGDVVRMAFIIDAFDREIIACALSAAPASGSTRHDAGGGQPSGGPHPLNSTTAAPPLDFVVAGLFSPL